MSTRTEPNNDAEARLVYEARLGAGQPLMFGFDTVYRVRVCLVPASNSSTRHGVILPVVHIVRPNVYDGLSVVSWTGGTESSHMAVSLRKIQASLLWLANTTGVSRTILNSEWRRKRLLILCYHAVSDDDEDQCFPGFFMPHPMFRRRMQCLKDHRINVLPLELALEKLYSGTLPERSAVITLDDGFYAAYRHCRPVLKEFGFPYTVYLTTYYIDYNRPVFDPMLRYLLWKAAWRTLEWQEVLPAPVNLDSAGRDRAASHIFQYVEAHNLSGEDKDTLLSELARRLGLGYDDMCRRRILHLVNADETRAWSRDASIQLHTHRHRVSRNKLYLGLQVQRNRIRLEEITGSKCEHLAYPGGAWIPEYADWVPELGIRSAVSCETGLASTASDRVILPRVMEMANKDLNYYLGWVTGVSTFLTPPREPHGPKQSSVFLEPAATARGISSAS